VRSVTGTYLHEKITSDKVKLMAMLREMKNKNITSFTHTGENKASMWNGMIWVVYKNL